ncbi:MAG: DUF5711 family protein [Clostridia bacterium]|nr:DUF5711 family protein [Clostridia bacterium]
MGSTNSMSRENKKKQLKRQIVPSGNPFQEEEDSQEIVHKAHRRVVRKRLIILAVIVVLAATAALVLFRYERYHTFTDYQTVWERDLVAEAQEAAAQGEGSFCEYRDFGDGVLKYTKDGATYLDAKGKVVWVQSYEMRSPVVSVNGDFVAIGDQQGNSIYICDQNGTQGQATTLLPILRVTVSAKGVVAALQEDSKASYIYLYKRDGSPLDIMVKSLLSSDGYPVDLSLSPNGTQLITSYMYLDQGMIKCKIVFYNFGLGKNDPNRVVGIFFPKDLGDAMAGRVRFLDESHSVIFTDKEIQFFSTRVETSPELVSQIPVEENIRSISYAQDKVGIVTDNVEGGDPYRLKIYDREGTPVFEKSFNYQYTGFDIDGDLVLLYNDSSCKVYNMTGTEKYNGTFDFTVSKVSAGRFPGTLLVMGPQKMTEIKLQ